MQRIQPTSETIAATKRLARERARDAKRVREAERFAQMAPAAQTLATARLQGHVVDVYRDRDDLERDGAQRIATQRVLDRYKSRKELDRSSKENNELLWQAGDRLYRDWLLSGAPPRMVASYAEAIPGGKGEMTDAQVQARQRYRRACMALPMTLMPVLVHVVCLDQPAGEWAKIRGFHEKSGMALLASALEELAVFYGMKKVC